MEEDRAREASRSLARLLAKLSLAAAALALGWFNWVDAPITDGAMLLVAAGELLLVAAASAALLSLEAAVAALPPRVQRWRRLALALLLSGLLLLVVAAVLTLNLRGTGDDAEGEQTATARIA